MNFFKGRGPDAAEESRENRVKKSILTEFSSLLKAIQSIQQSRPGEPIYTCDEVDKLCILFDSVFIHRLKSGEQMRGLELKHIHEQSFNFWSFVRRFTHRGTIEQIEKLSHLQTPVGYCRSWVRMAVSDGLMESYLASMIKQPNVLRKYYQSTAFLRDDEQSDILLKLIQILSHFDFQLVYNSQGLNKWTTDALSLSGYLRQITQSEQIVSQLLPPPVTVQTHDDRMRSESLDMEDVPEFVTAAPINTRQPAKRSSDKTFHSDTETESETIEVDHSKQKQSNSSNLTNTKQLTHPEPVEKKTSNLASSHKQHDDIDSQVLTSSKTETEPITSGEPQITSGAKLRATQELERLRNITYTLNDVFQPEPAVLPKSSPIIDSVSTVNREEVESEDTERSGDADCYMEDHEIDHIMSADLGGVGADNSENIYSTEDNSEDVTVREDESEDAYPKADNPIRTVREGNSEIYVREDNSEIYVKEDDCEVHEKEDKSETVVREGESEGFYTRKDNSEDTAIESEDSYVYNPFVDEEYHSLSSSHSRSDHEHVETGELSNSPKRIFKVGTPDITGYIIETRAKESSGSSITEYDDNVKDRTEVYNTPPRVESSSTHMEDTTGSLPEFDSPLSAAKIIMDRQSGSDIQSVSRSLPRESLEGQIFPVSGSLGRGNSLASLTGWSGAESASLPKSSNLNHVTSLAQIRSSTQTQESITPNKTELYSDNLTNNTSLQTQENATTDKVDNSQISEPSTPPKSQPKSPDDFELIQGYQDTCADILRYYGLIRNEPGLDEQNFQCHSCKAPIGIIYGAARVCGYTGSYYCSQCHNNEDSIIPSKVVCNWDFAKYKVAKASKDFLVSAEMMPLLNIESLNYKIYQHVQELERCRMLRVQLNYIRRYLLACGPAISEELRLLVAPKEYLYEEVHTYSVQDLLLINISSKITRVLRKSVKFGSAHVKNCSSCEYRGFRCEICRTTEILFPFELEKTHTCELCNAVYHRSCFIDTCSKCERLKHRDELLASSPIAQDDTHDHSLTIHT